MLTFLLTYLIHNNLFCIAQSLFNIHGDLINFHKKQWEVKPPNICIWVFKFVEQNVLDEVLKTALDDKCWYKKGKTLHFNYLSLKNEKCNENFLLLLEIIFFVSEVYHWKLYEDTKKTKIVFIKILHLEIYLY